MGLIIFHHNLLKMKRKSISWGRYPKHKYKIVDYNLNKVKISDNILPFGNGRSYGDSCIADELIDMKRLDKFIHFNEEKGTLIIQAGVLLKEIIDVFLPKGWFLKINPGTKLITVGGAIAADVHGKNHHKEGCFSDCIKWFKLVF